MLQVFVLCVLVDYSVNLSFVLKKVLAKGVIMGSPDRVSCFAGGGCQVVNLVGDMYPFVSCTLCHEKLWKVMDFENAFVRT